MNNKEEYILCATNWYTDIDLMNPEVLEPRGYRPVNCDKGIVICGQRHHNCIYALVALVGMDNKKEASEIQGFLTSKNRFVDRKEAWIVAEKAEQIIQQSGGKGTLYSEDLY